MAIIYDESAEAYHANAALGSSDIRDFIRSPRLFQDRQEGAAKRETAAMLFGTASHMALLEPERFARCAVTQPLTYMGEDRKGNPVEKAWTYQANACCDWREEMVAAGKIVLTEQERTHLFYMHERMPDSVRRIFATGRSEVTVRTTIDGIPVQCRVDWWNLTGRIKYEFKTINSIERVEDAVWKLGYHVQDRWYARVIAAETKEAPPASRIVFAETQPPYRWRVCSLDLDYIFMADRDIDDALAGIKARSKSGCWDDPADIELMVSPPAWANDSDVTEDEE